MLEIRRDRDLIVLMHHYRENCFDITFDWVVQLSPMTYCVIVMMSRFILYHKFKDLIIEITIMKLGAKLLFCP